MTMPGAPSPHVVRSCTSPLSFPAHPGRTCMRMVASGHLAAPTAATKSSWLSWPARKLSAEPVSTSSGGRLPGSAPASQFKKSQQARQHQDSRQGSRLM